VPPQPARALLNLTSSEFAAGLCPLLPQNGEIFSHIHDHLSKKTLFQAGFEKPAALAQAF
jgi:hypothetical protein